MQSKRFNDFKYRNVLYDVRIEYKNKNDIVITDIYESKTDTNVTDTFTWLDLYTFKEIILFDLDLTDHKYVYQ